MNNAGKTTPSGGRRRACRGARTYVIVGAALGAVFLHAPVAEANPGQPAVESGTRSKVSRPPTPSAG
ncbi:hypothetical protein MTX34_24310 [Rhodococcus sp. ARC_M5]|nr:hypothetical protein [Rhodococcus sp. ARC_M5]